MKKLLTLIFLTVVCPGIYAQAITTDTVKAANVTVNKDPRLDILAKAEAEINNMASRFAMGYRLFVLKTNNRDYAMKVRTYLLQNFPEEKVIMTYQAPFIKMKFGNFIEKKDAEKYRDMIVKGGVVTGGVYVVPETVEVDPSKIKEND
jgi:hypothetical protein